MIPIQDLKCFACGEPAWAGSSTYGWFCREHYPVIEGPVQKIDMQWPGPPLQVRQFVLQKRPGDAQTPRGMADTTKG